LSPSTKRPASSVVEGIKRAKCVSRQGQRPGAGMENPMTEVRTVQLISCGRLQANRVRTDSVG
jgi:hypothetical protein